MQQRRSECLDRLKPMALQTLGDSERVSQLAVYRSSLGWPDARASGKPSSSVTRHKGRGVDRQAVGSLTEYFQLPAETNYTGEKNQNILLGTFVHKVS